MKKWTTPELVVLDRGTPAEAVLSFCKTPLSATASGPVTEHYGHCDQDPSSCNTCDTPGIVS
jgi:hypothetical protein